MASGFRTHEVRELAWVFNGPGLLSPAHFGSRIESDADLQNRFVRFRDVISDLDQNPRDLLEFLKQRPTGGRLGRYFENLLQYYLLHLEGVTKHALNLQVREGRRTVGELDLVFKIGQTLPVHWEASVKFYLCSTESPAEAVDPQFFMGTLVHDRLDRKIKKLFESQLRLPDHPEAREKLRELGLEAPRSRAIMKGFFFYPSRTDWPRAAHPAEVSTNHLRGWWTTASRLEIPKFDQDSRYIVLPFARWLAPFDGRVEPHELIQLDELQWKVRRLFDSSWARPVNYELMIAEVAVKEETSEGPWVTERSRGNILHPKWPEHARTSLVV